jgi:hypothetical protein
MSGRALDGTWKRGRGRRDNTFGPTFGNSVWHNGMFPLALADNIERLSVSLDIGQEHFERPNVDKTTTFYIAIVFAVWAML